MLGYRFNRPELLERALTHSSWANEAGQGERHNERLEFLGDAVLELCVSAELYRRFPTSREGILTRMRALLVSAASLARLARQTGIDQALKLGKGEDGQGGRDRDSILSDAFEAVLGAVFEDGGFEAARQTVARVFASHWPGSPDNERVVDCKSRLQEISQHLFHDFPVYALERATGPAHAKIFEVSLRLPNGMIFHASNSSCKKAEQDAAALALEALERANSA